MIGNLRPKKLQVNTKHLPLWRAAEGKPISASNVSLEDLLRKKPIGENKKGNKMDPRQTSFLHKFFLGKHRSAPELAVQIAIDKAQKQKNGTLTIKEAIETEIKRQQEYKSADRIDLVEAVNNIYFYLTNSQHHVDIFSTGTEKSLSQIQSLEKNEHFKTRVKKTGLSSFGLACIELQIPLADRIAIEAHQILKENEQLIGKKADANLQKNAIIGSLLKTREELIKEEIYQRKRRI